MTRRDRLAILDDLIADGVELPTFVDWSDELTRSRPPTRWIVPGVFAAGRSYSVVSAPKAGKSLFMLEQLVRARARTVYLDYENSAADLLDRIAAMGFDAADLANLHYVHFPEFEIDQPLGAQRLLAAVRAHRADVVVVDTLVRAIGGREENAEALSYLYRRVSVPLKRAGITIVRLDHTGHGDQRRARGSSDKAADIDASWTLKRTSSGQPRVTLDLALQRSADHLPRITYAVRADPLRFHSLTAAPGDDIPPEVRELVDHLDRLNVPANLGRDRVRQLLAAEGIRPGRNDVVGEALTHRRQRPNRSATTSVPESVPEQTGGIGGDSLGRDTTFSKFTPDRDRSGTAGTASVSDPSPHLSPLEGDRGRSNRPGTQTHPLPPQGKRFAEGGTTVAVLAAAERGTSGEPNPTTNRGETPTTPATHRLDDHPQTGTHDE